LQLIRTIDFLRHVPPRQVARRLWLEARRRALATLSRAAAVPSPAGLGLRAKSFAPPARPAAGTIQARPDGFVFTFLGRPLSKPRSIDWTTPAAAPADQLWRMNLHYMEYLGGVDDATFVDLVDQWIMANRPYLNRNWRDAWNAYALSIRVTVWLEELCRRARLPSAFVVRLLDSVGEQLRFLIANVETDIGGNHLVKNIRALATAGHVLSGPQAERARQLALKLLADVLQQILPDGVHAERSPSYHNQVLADLIAIRHAVGDALDLGRCLDATIATMAQAGVDLAHPDGKVALFGDAGLSMAVDAGDLLPSRGTLPAPRRHFAFAHAGYFGFRDGGTYLVIDCGRLGPDALMAHAHGDALSFELSVAGERIVIDQGVFEYVAGQRRDASRAARSHNTVAIEGLDQAEFFGAFRCGARPDVDVLDYAELPNGLRLEGRHDGFTRTGRGPVHRRRFTFENGVLDIHDRLEGPLPAPVSGTLLLHPACHAIDDGGALVVTRAPARLRIDASVPFSVEPAVWWLDMGVEQPTKRIVFRWPHGTSEVRTRIAILA
jgi:uncharacterized heparinase superfamily protein